MSAKFKKTVFWGAMLTPMVMVLHFLLGGFHVAEAHGHGPKGMEMGRQGFAGHHMMGHPHFFGGFHWIGSLLFFIAIIAIVVWVVKRMKGKAKTSSMQQMIDTSFVSTPQQMSSRSGNVLDQWEKQITNKKENE